MESKKTLNKLVVFAIKNVETGNFFNIVGCALAKLLEIYAPREINTDLEYSTFPENDSTVYSCLVVNRTNEVGQAMATTMHEALTQHSLHAYNAHYVTAFKNPAEMDGKDVAMIRRAACFQIGSRSEDEKKPK